MSVLLLPVLILSNYSHNELSDDFVCCGITSNLDNKDSSILLEHKDMKVGSIPKRSRIKYDKIFTLEKSLAIKKLGKINLKKMNLIRNSLKKLFS
ncbi:MAG: type II toxin-antitoxin system PemK/MazF family toxin [Thaumarchaeota archaeon]|nr:type II toxin-antitoxin system PemK/MazF family toxin [Nitrososphaerota archaeon]